MPFICSRLAAANASLPNGSLPATMNSTSSARRSSIVERSPFLLAASHALTDSRIACLSSPIACLVCISSLSSSDNARIDCLTGARNCLKVQLVSGHFKQHEVKVAIERLRGQRRRLLHIASTELASSSGDKIIDSLLRFDSLIHVIVSRQHYIDSILHKDRL